MAENYQEGAGGDFDLSQFYQIFSRKLARTWTRWSTCCWIWT